MLFKRKASAPERKISGLPITSLKTCEPWERIRECTQFSYISPQPIMPDMSDEMSQSEDCLYLNMVTPAHEPDERLPVMVWIHDGEYSMDCGNDKI